jgi:osmotically-inducible protein OsmY
MSPITEEVQIMRPDRELQADIIRELEWEPRVDSANIGVTVDQGAVTLTGHVRTYAEQVAAERAVTRIYGVRAVANELVVKLPNDWRRDDSDIALATSNQLAWNVSIPKDAIRASVRQGWVTLDGQVDWAYQSVVAEKIVRGLIGVKGVTNRVVVRPRVQTKDVQAKITEALHRQAQIDARRIWLTTEDGHVTLHGQVSSWSEAEAAKKASASAPGVTRVESALTITP